MKVVTITRSKCERCDRPPTWKLRIESNTSIDDVHLCDFHKEMAVQLYTRQPGWTVIEKEKK